jgi:hypothetical protein
MDLLNDHVSEYTWQLQKGHIQKAYKGIMTIMTDLRAYLALTYPDYVAGALYFGYMDMTYFSFTPPDLKKLNLKIAVIYLHEENRFEIWLAGGNRKIQADYIALISKKDTGKYTLSQIQPGVDAIIAAPIIEKPDFDNPADLKRQIGLAVKEFTTDIAIMID